MTCPLKQLLDVPAPAKINLFLHIVGRRADGYHLLQSVFALVDWADTLHFECRADGQIQRHDVASHQTLPAVDLVVRAARLLQTATQCPYGVDITLNKQLPMEAGLGGGSSDAASCLLALNQLWGLHLPLQTLLPLAAQLGADVPFFVGGHNAWVEGIGEKLEPIVLPPTPLVIIKPPTGASTPAIFQHPALQRDQKTVTMEDLIASAGSFFEFGQNALQPVAASLCPDIEIGLAWLSKQGLNGRMTGSGTALFAPCPAAMDFTQLQATLPNGWTGKQCNILNVHPLIGWR
jgi:4-diphosphocytidyl-2-C-methyl-D-erythritol kinase